MIKKPKIIEYWTINQIFHTKKYALEYEKDRIMFKFDCPELWVTLKNGKDMKYSEYKRKYK